MKKYIIAFLLLAIALVGCSQTEKKEKTLSENGQAAKVFLEEMGYEVEEVDKEGTQELSKKDLLTKDAQQVWAVQYKEPDEFLGKKIDTVGFTVKNHPLDDRYREGKTKVTVFLVDGEVIGGWSYPIASTPLASPPYSLDGKTAEEVKGDYFKWLDEIEGKYSE